jgi:O-6-methylguanine DNA methyltransferase
MHTSTKPAEAVSAGERSAVADEFQTVSYATPGGDGWITLRGDMPWELGLPGKAAGRPVLPAAQASAAAHKWADLLQRYFAGEQVHFPLDVAAFAAARGYTRFETDVISALAALPYGSTISYRGLAAAAGRPSAQRAAGSVMARNPLPIILPCHRVVRSNGTLGNYGDDPRWKEWLLQLEGALPGERRAGSREVPAPAP